MFTFFNDDEEAKLNGLPLMAQIIYMRGIRRFMDGENAITGIKRKISYQSLIETVYVEPKQGRAHEPRPTIKKMRNIIKILSEQGLIQTIEKDRQLVFFCPLATTNNYVQKKEGRAGAEQGQTKHGRLNATDNKALTEKHGIGMADNSQPKKGIHQIVKLSNIKKENYKRKSGEVSVPDFIDKQLWEEWLNFRKENKLANTVYELKTLIENLKGCENENISANDAIKIALQQKWKSVKSDWVISYQRSQNKQHRVINHGITREELESTDFF